MQRSRMATAQMARTTVSALGVRAARVVGGCGGLRAALAQSRITLVTGAGRRSMATDTAGKEATTRARSRRNATATAANATPPPPPTLKQRLAAKARKLFGQKESLASPVGDAQRPKADNSARAYMRPRIRARSMYSPSNLRALQLNQKIDKRTGYVEGPWQKPKLVPILPENRLEPAARMYDAALNQKLVERRREVVALRPREPLRDVRGTGVKEQLCRTPFMKTSVKKLMPLARLIDGKDLRTAMLHMMFCKRKPANEVLWALHTGARIARDVQKLPTSKLYVAWAQVGRGEYEKKPDIKGRGRCGLITAPEAHMQIMLRVRAKGANAKPVERRVPRPNLEKHIINARIRV